MRSVSEARAVIIGCSASTGAGAGADRASGTRARRRRDCILGELDDRCDILGVFEANGNSIEPRKSRDVGSESDAILFVLVTASVFSMLLLTFNKQGLICKEKKSRRGRTSSRENKQMKREKREEKKKSKGKLDKQIIKTPR